MCLFAHQVLRRDRRWWGWVTEGPRRGANSMPVEGATATPTAIAGRDGGNETKQNDPYRFLSTRLVRELIAADSVAEAVDEGAAATAARLLAVVSDGLSQPGVALLDAATLSVVACRGFEAEEQGLLQTPPPGGDVPLARRALQERRVFLLGRGSREPLLPALREVRNEWSGLAVVPLCDREQCAGVLVLASTEATLPAAFLRSLAPAFRLLTLLLHPGRRADFGGQEVVGAGDAERLSVEVEELRSQLAEARDQTRLLQDEDSSSQAAQRAESETLRARVAELEAALAAGGTHEGRVAELESEIARRTKEVEERDDRVARLEAENRSLTESTAEAEQARRDADARAAESSSAEEALREAMNQSGVADAESEDLATALPMLDEEDLELGEIAEAAAAAIGDDAGGDEQGFGTAASADEPEVIEPADAVTDTVAPPDEAVPTPSGPPLGLWHMDTDPTSLAWAGELAERSGAVLWTGEGEPPLATKNMLVMNLFDDSVSRALELIDHDVDSLVYATDPESGQGFEIGSVGWVRRPLDPAIALEKIQSRVPRRLGGIVIVSAQLRELAGLRQALAAVDAAGSVACDARQATDLLEIVRRPDAVLIDLTLDGGQGLVLARQLRTTPETRDVPIVFLLPETLQPGMIRADAERGGILEAYGSDDARRLLNGALAHFC